MAFSFGSLGAGAGAGAGGADGQTTQGQDLELIQTEVSAHEEALLWVEI